VAGHGLLFVQAVQNVDIPIMAAYLLMVSLIYVTINLVVDILYTVVDPRCVRPSAARPEQRDIHVRRRRPASSRIQHPACACGQRLVTARVRERHLLFVHPLQADDGGGRDHAVVLPARDLCLPARGPEPVRSGAASVDEFADLAAVDADGQSPFLLGTDEQGRDVFSAILYGLRISLVVGVLGVIFAGALGITLGLVAGYVGGAVDGLIMRIADVQLTFRPS